MASRLLELPQELQAHIFRAVEEDHQSVYPPTAFVSWSCTCSFYRIQLAPYIFKHVVLRNTQKSGESIKAVTQGCHAKHVRELQYEGLFYDVNEDVVDGGEPSNGHDVDGGNNDNSNRGSTAVEQASSCDGRLLPLDVRSVLSNLAALPMLHTLTIRFDWPTEEEGNIEGTDTPHWDLVTDELDDSDKEESNVAWQAFLNATFDALAANPCPNIRRLELLDTLAFEAAAFDTEGWRKLLRTLESFHLQLRGGHNGAGWHISTLDVYQEYVQSLDDLFFDHLTAVTDLAIEASRDGPLGAESILPLRLRPEQMPALTTLRLANMFIGADMVSLITGRCDTLTSIEFVNVYGSEVESEDACGFTPWYTLFDAMREARPRRLRRFELRDLNAPLIPSYMAEQDAPPSDEVTEVRQALQADPSRRVFPYAALDGKYGFISTDEDLNVDMFRQGADQAAYDQLMELVARNAKKAL